MTRFRFTVALCLLLVLAAALPALADVKTEEKSLTKFEGLVGKMMGLFGGKAAREGVASTVAVKANRKATITGDSGEIIDLDQEQVYTLDLRKKQYRVTSFAELRRQLEEAKAKAAQARSDEQPAQPQTGEKEPEMEIDFSIKESGQSRRINNYDCREVILTVTMRQKGKTLDQGGGMVMTSHIWLGPKIPYLQEIADFDRRYAEKLQGPYALSAADAQQMAAALALYPGMQEMMGKFEAQKVNMEGTEVLTVTTMESVKSPEQMQQEQKEQESESSPASGLGGLLGRKLLKKKPQESGGPANRTKIFTMEHELVRAEPAASDADVGIPAGFKQAK
ncbi:MAG: hypothetical protein ABIG68_08305 [Acidobacteriota bacterium]